MSPANSCDNGPPWCEQYRRLTAERDEALAANGNLANLIGKLEAALEEIARLDSPPLGRYGIIAREALELWKGGPLSKRNET